MRHRHMVIAGHRQCFGVRHQEASASCISRWCLPTASRRYIEYSLTPCLAWDVIVSKLVDVLHNVTHTECPIRAKPETDFRQIPRHRWALMWTISTLKAKHLSRWHRRTNRRQDSRCLIRWENPILGISKWAIATLLTKMMGCLQWSSDKPCDKPWDFAVSYFQTCRNVHLRQATIQLLRAHGAQWWPTVHMARNDKKCRNANEVSSKTQCTVP